MTRFLLFVVLGVSTALGLLRPPPLGEAASVAKTLAQTPVTGRLADGGTFQGRLTLQALRFDEAGELVATGVLLGTATPAAGRTMKVPAHTFTTPVALLDLRGTCRTRRGSGAAHCGPARAGTHARARGPGSRNRAAGGAPVAEGALYRGAPPGVRRISSPQAGHITERRPVRTAWSMRACARAGPQGLGMHTSCHAVLAPRVHPLRMRGQAWSSSILCQRAACLSCPPLKAEDREKMAYFLLSHRINALAHRRVERHCCASLHLRKEHIPCLPYIVSCLRRCESRRQYDADRSGRECPCRANIHSPSSPGSAWPHRHPARPGTGARKSQAE